MANPFKGDVAFSCDGKEYSFRLGTYALAILQRKTGVPTLKFLNKKPEDWGADDMLAVFYAGLHREHKLSEEQVSDLMDNLGGDRVAEIFSEALKVATDSEAASSPPNPAEPPGK